MNIQDKAKLIELMILDIDGVLTDGQLIYTATGDECKAFHTHDGTGIRMLQSVGIHVALITARQSNIVVRRAKELNIRYVYQRQNNKLEAYEHLKHELGLESRKIGYMGDDLIDLPLLQQVGFSVTVPNAYQAVLKHVDWITTKKGGEGAVREVCDFILNAKNQWENACQLFLKS